MIFSQMSKVAIKAVIYIAVQSEQQEVATIKSIAHEVDESEHTVGKILQTLVHEGIIFSNKGMKGGFYISESQTRNPVSAIVKAIQGHTHSGECVLGLRQCSASVPCPLHYEYLKALKVIDEIMSNNTIDELAQLVKNGERNLVN